MGWKNAAYARVSSDPDGTSVSPEAQLEECRQEAERRGWDWAKVTQYIDRDLSAWKRSTHRPGWYEVVEGIRTGAIDGLIVHHLDRMLRQVRDLEQLIDAIEQRGGKFPIYSVHGDLDLSTPDGRAMARIVVTIAQKESDDKSRRLQLVLGAKARDGKSHGGKRPYGYDEADRTKLVPAERDVILELVDWVFDGVSLTECARRLNDAGVPTAHGGSKWFPQVIRRMLLSPRYAGLRSHKGTVVAEGDWEPVFPLDVHERLVQLLERPATGTGRTERRWWATSVLQCGVCGRSMASIPHSSGRRYHCDKRYDGCGNGILAKPIDQIIETVTLGILREGYGAERAVELVGDAQECDELEASLAQLARDFYIDHVIDRVSFEAVNEDLRQRLAIARESARPKTITTSGDPDADWKDATVQRRIEIVSSTLDRVVIAQRDPRATRLDLGRVSLYPA